MDSVHREISDRLRARKFAKRILWHLEAADDAVLPREQVQELERLVAEGLPNHWAAALSASSRFSARLPP